MLGELHLGHDRPGGAAGGAHERHLVGNLVDEVAGLLHGAQVGAERDLLHAGEAELLERLAQFVDVALAAELADEGRGDLGDDLLPPTDGVDDLEDLALVGDGAERAVHEALAAGDALVVVDLGATLLIGADGVHAAGGGAGALVVMDGRVRAHRGAAAALDALGLVDVGLAVHKGDRALGADLAAGMRHAALARIAHAVDVVLAGVAREADDVDQRRLVIGLGLRGLGHALGKHRGLIDTLQGQAHRQADALAHDGALDEHALAVRRDIARNDLVGQVVDPAVIIGIDHTVAIDVDAALVGDARDLFEDGTTNLGDVRVHTSHGVAHIVVPSRTFVRRAHIL